MLGVHGCTSFCLVVLSRSHFLIAVVGFSLRWFLLWSIGHMGFTSYSSLTVAAAAAKSLQSCPTLCDPIDGSPPGSAIPGILQARTLEWVAISFSSA